MGRNMKTVKTKTKRTAPNEQGTIDYTDQILAADLGWKYAPTRYTGPPTVGIKKQGKIHMNRASADAFLRYGFERALLMRSRNTLFILGERDRKNPAASAITFGKGGVPALITGKTTLRNLRIKTDVNQRGLPARIWRPEKEIRNENITLGPEDVVLVVDLPRDILEDGR